MKSLLILNKGSWFNILKWLNICTYVQTNTKLRHIIVGGIGRNWDTTRKAMSSNQLSLNIYATPAQITQLWAHAWYRDIKSIYLSWQPDSLLFQPDMETWKKKRLKSLFSQKALCATNATRRVQKPFGKHPLWFISLKVSSICMIQCSIYASYISQKNCPNKPKDVVWIVFLSATLNNWILATSLFAWEYLFFFLCFCFWCSMPSSPRDGSSYIFRREVKELSSESFCLLSTMISKRKELVSPGGRNEHLFKKVLAGGAGV